MYSFIHTQCAVRRAGQFTDQPFFDPSRCRKEIKWPATGAMTAFLGDCVLHETAEKLTLLFGQLYPRMGYRARPAPTMNLDTILRMYWGKFVLCEINKITGDVVCATDHLGTIPCYYHEDINGTSIFLNLDDFRQVVQKLPDLDLRYLASQVAFSQVSTNETAFSGVRQVAPGHKLSLIGGRLRSAPYWEPISVAEESTTQIGAEDGYREMLYASLDYAVTQLTRNHRRALCFLSGGLDSSVVTACVASKLGAQQVVGFNVSDDSAIGDETRYAQLVASHLEIPLVHHVLRAQDYNLIEVLQGQIRPVPHKFGTGFEILDKADQLAQSRDTTVAFSGVGGDAIYLAGHNSKYAHDYLKLMGLKGLWSKIEQTAFMSHKTVWQVCYDLWEFNYSKKKQKLSPYQNYVTLTFLSERALETINLATLNTQWTQQSRHLPRGKQHQILNLIATSHANSSTTRVNAVEVLHPLLSIPVVEACLKTPTFMLSGKNIDRSLVRSAFEHAIPKQVAWRRTKGGGGAFYLELIINQRSQLIDFLASGRLAQLGIINVDRVARAIEDLNDGDTYESHTKLYELTITEAWARAVERASTVQEARP